MDKCKKKKLGKTFYYWKEKHTSTQKTDEAVRSSTWDHSGLQSRVYVSRVTQWDTFSIQKEKGWGERSGWDRKESHSQLQFFNLHKSNDLKQKRPLKTSHHKSFRGSKNIGNISQHNKGNIQWACIQNHAKWRKTQGTSTKVRNKNVRSLRSCSVTEAIAQVKEMTMIQIAKREVNVSLFTHGSTLKTLKTTPEISYR